MLTNTQRPIHARHADLVEGLRDYLTVTARSARWLGTVTANDPRMLANLARGQSYPAALLVALSSRLVAFYEEQLTRAASGQDNEGEPLPVAA